jgi:hypothetical protein
LILNRLLLISNFHKTLYDFNKEIAQKFPELLKKFSPSTCAVGPPWRISRRNTLQSVK